jgi:protein-S-isoprenylcysteine O-methyltransferase Ste14
MDAPRELVVEGPYRFLRNPMAVAGLGQASAVGLWLGSWSVLAYVLAGGVIWHILVRPVEEADLARRFGPPYEAYRRSTPLWIPSPFPSAQVRPPRPPRGTSV